MPKEKDLVKLNVMATKDFHVAPPRLANKPGSASNLTKSMSKLKVNKNNNRKGKVQHPNPFFWNSYDKNIGNLINKDSKKKERVETNKTHRIEVNEKADTESDVPASWDELVDDDKKENKTWVELAQEDNNNTCHTEMFSWDNDNEEVDDTLDLESLEKNNTREQYKLSANIEVSGVPRVKSENLTFIIRKICDFLNIRIEESDIVSVEREVSKRHEGGLPPVPIVCKFRSRDLKNEIIVRFRKQRIVTSKDIGFFGDTRNIYIQHHLTPYNKYLYHVTRKAARSKDYKFAWVKNGKIYVRKERETDALRIDVLEDVEGKII